MIEISLEREKIIKSLKELEKEYTKGNIPKSHYNLQKRQLKEQLETFEVADRVRRLQGKETAEVAEEETDKEEENGELFKKYITPTGLKEKNLKSKKTSLNTKIGAGVLVAAFFIGIIFGVYGLIPQQVSSAPLYTNDTAFPPFVLNSTNTTNSTNSTNMTRNVTKNVTVTKPINNTPTKTINTTPTTNNDTPNVKKAAGSPTTHKTTYPTYQDQIDKYMDSNYGTGNI